MKMVNSLPTEIKDKYPVLNQISRLPYKGSEKIIQLNDQKLVKGDLATTYYQNLRELGDVTVTKLNDPVENQRLSDVFRVFSLMMIHQHGVGYSKYGFVKALDDTDYLEVMRNASEIFMNQHLNNSTLSAIYNRLMGDSQFKDYVMSPEEFVSTTIPSPETYMPLKNIVDEFIMQKGEEAFNALMVSEGTDMTILDVPANVSYVGLSKNDYDDYVQVDYQTLNTMLNRLTANGINPTIVPEMFNDFATDTSMNLNEFVEWLKSKVEANLEQIPEEEINAEYEPVASSPKDYVNHSGGAYGGDTFWDMVGRKFGVQEHKHYRESSNTNLSQKLKKTLNAI
jgi:hypothetical protein